MRRLAVWLLHLPLRALGLVLVPALLRLARLLPQGDGASSQEGPDWPTFYS